MNRIAWRNPDDWREGVRVPLRFRVRRWLRRAQRPRRGPARLASDLVAVERLLAPAGASARLRLEAELGRPLLEELDRMLGQRGRLLAPRQRRRLLAARQRRLRKAA